MLSSVAENLTESTPQFGFEGPGLVCEIDQNRALLPSHCTYLIEDMRLFVSFVNWHLWFLLEHSEHAEVSVASHCNDGQHQTIYTCFGRVRDK